MIYFNNQLRNIKNIFCLLMNIDKIVVLGFVFLVFAPFLVVLKNLDFQVVSVKVTLGNFIKLKACDKCKLITFLLMDR